MNCYDEWCEPHTSYIFMVGLDIHISHELNSSFKKWYVEKPFIITLRESHIPFKKLEGIVKKIFIRSSNHYFYCNAIWLKFKMIKLSWFRFHYQLFSWFMSTSLSLIMDAQKCSQYFSTIFGTSKDQTNRILLYK